MIDHASRQRATIARENLVFIAENISQEAFVMAVHRREYPAGSRWFWAIQQVWAPRSAAQDLQNKEAAE